MGNYDYSNCPYPVTIVGDRYTSIYSKALFTAWPCEPRRVPEEIEDEDCECWDFWNNFDGIVGKGDTPNDALRDLAEKLKPKPDSPSR